MCFTNIFNITNNCFSFVTSYVINIDSIEILKIPYYSTNVLPIRISDILEILSRLGLIEYELRQTEYDKTNIITLLNLIADFYPEDLKNEMHTELDNLPNRDIITFHEAFPYFAEEFNLNIAGVIEIEPDSEPSAKEIEEIIKDCDFTFDREPEYLEIQFTCK